MNVYENGIGAILIVSQQELLLFDRFVRFSNEVFNEYPKWSYSGDLMECEGSHFSTGGHFSPPGLGVMTRFLQTKNDPFGRRKWPPGHFST